MKQLGCLSSLLYYFINYDMLMDTAPLIDDGIVSKSKMNYFKYEFSLSVISYLIENAELKMYCPISVPTTITNKYEMLHLPDSYIVEGDKSTNELVRSVINLQNSAFTDVNLITYNYIINTYLYIKY